MTFQQFLESPEGQRCLNTPFPSEPSMSERLRMAFEAGRHSTTNPLQAKDRGFKEHGDPIFP